ncbi:MAG: HAD family hydrolase [Candidatus Woesearchaeota archaeon]|jgi:HAD superfamily hydrolase (TIGR01549 family)|nr:HAD family hydrolase [Candidatus Woesearchaeota archaeon]
MNNIKAVLFDMDGVLIDSFEAWFHVFNGALANFNFKTVTKKEFIKNCWAIDSSIIIPKYFPEIDINEVADYYQENFLEFDKHIKILPNVEQTLKKLKEKKIKTAVVTNTYHEQAEETLKKIKLHKYFNTFACADDVEVGKPEPDIIFKALKDLNIEKENAIFIGDTKTDISAGKNAEIFTIGLNVNGGNKKIKDLKELMQFL